MSILRTASSSCHVVFQGMDFILTLSVFSIDVFFLEIYTIYLFMNVYPGYLDIYLYGAVALYTLYTIRWYSQCTSVLEVAGSIPTPDIVVIVIVLTENQS